MALQTRLDPMNASPYHPKVRVSLKLAEPLFVAGSTITGKMEVECKADKGLGIGVIMAELFAIEELTSRDHSATSTFLHPRRLFQGPGLPPSNAVHPHPTPGDPPLPCHHYPARRGVTTFLFQFSLPESSPSSINFGSSLANVRYEIRASVSVAWKGQKSFVMDKKLVDVVECFEKDHSRMTVPEGLIVGENGKIWVQGKVVGGFMVAGQPACIELQVKNHSAKKNTGLAVSLTRQLHLSSLASSQKQLLQISDTLTSVSFRGAEYIIQAGAEGVANLVVDVPKAARGVKGGKRRGNDESDSTTEPLFEVRCIVSVKLSMGIGSKDVRLDLPVMILHPLALSTVPFPDPYSVSPQPYNGLIYDPMPLTLCQPSTSPASYQQYPISSYPSPPTSPFALPYLHQGQVWLPPPSAGPFSPPPVSYPYYHSDPVMSYIPPLRPTSAEPIPSQPLYGLPTSYVQQPLPSLSLNQPIAEREEGKGERASRITLHLRMSSRHRSASPPSHRFAIPVSSDPHTPPTPPTLSLPVERLTLKAYSSYSPSSSPHSRPRLQPPPLDLPTSPACAQGLVVSPRPMLSPKHSFSVDPVAQVTHIENLERIAARVDSHNADMSVSGAELDLGPNNCTGHENTADRDKTLPSPPVSTDKNGVAQVRTKLDSLFPEETPTPPTPTLAAVTSLKVPCVNSAHAGGLDLIGGVSGLDALEAKLLAEVGTRKIEKAAHYADVRSVLPISIPRSTDQQDPAVDSAISSLTLPALGSEPRTLKREEPIHRREIGEDAKSESKKAEIQGSNKDGGSRKHGGERANHSKDDEFYRLRKAAQGRVAAWLGSIEPDVFPQATSPPTSLETVLPAQDGERSEGDAEALQDLSKNVSPDAASPDVSAAPNPRSSGFLPIGTIRSNIQVPIPTGNVNARNSGKDSPNPKTPLARVAVVPPRLAAYPLQPPDPEVRYDIRSARGGRGGKVTAVAAIWASATQQQDNNSKPVVKHSGVSLAKTLDLGKTPTMKPLPQKSLPLSEPPKPPSNAKLSLAPIRPRETKAAPAVDISAKRGRMTKASTSPAAVSSSLATPMLSSTASLARPTPPLSDRNNLKLPTSIPEMSRLKPSDPKPNTAKGELAFGQARLRELIKRYQGQTNA
ncbi:hypothetical protein BKA93DRAFT_727408 [Sparassis latifolia]